MVALFVVATVGGFLLVDFFVQKSRKKASLRRVGQVSDRFSFPRGYFLGKGHSWVQLLFSGKARIGMDDFIRKIVGPINAVELPLVGTTVRKGEALVVLRQNGKRLTLPSPISGKVVEINQEVAKRPEILADDPYVNGWLLTVEPKRAEEELRLLHIADDAATWLKDEINRFRDFIQVRSATHMLSPAGVTMLDGGLPVVGVLEGADQNVWYEFSDQFLSEMDWVTPDRL